jgi:hypothetical protein
MEPPKLTPEARQEALEKAARARRERALVKERLRTGDLTLTGVLDLAERDELVGGIKVKAVLTSLPGLGKVKSHRLMEALGIAENRRLRGLGAKQREALRSALS